MPSAALASWPLDAPRAPPQALRRQSCAVKGSAWSCGEEAKPLGGK